MLGRIKKSLKFLVGGVVCRAPLLEPYKLALLRSWESHEPRGLLNRALFNATISYWYEREYRAEPDPDRRDRLRDLMMSGELGVRWARDYGRQPIDLTAKVGGMAYAEACPLLPEMDRILSSASAPALVVQVGSSSGRELAWLARRHPRHAFLGTDLYPEVTDFAAAQNPLPNLRFETCSASGLPTRLEAESDRTFVISSGSLQYVQPERMSEFFCSLCRPGREILVLEPADESGGSPLDIAGTAWRGGLSYSHNYRYYGEAARFATKACRVIRPYAPYENFPMHRNTVHYFYHGRA